MLYRHLIYIMCMNDKTRNKALTVYFSLTGASLLVAALFECGLIDGGWLAVESQVEFVVATVMVLLTMGCIPLALRLMRLKSIASKVQTGDKSTLARWVVVRIMLLGVPMLANTIIYYAFMSPRFGYLALILLLCMLCIYPSKDKAKEEHQ